MCQVNFINQDNFGRGLRYIHNSYGLGLTMEQVVQEAAHTAIGWYRFYNPDLDSEESVTLVRDSGSGTRSTQGPTTLTL